MPHRTSRTTRRTTLKTIGLLVFTGTAGVAAGSPAGNGRGNGDNSLRRFSEVTVPGAQEVVTQETWAYVATGDGFAVVDWRNPNRPERVVDVPRARYGHRRREGRRRPSRG